MFREASPRQAGACETKEGRARGVRPGDLRGSAGRGGPPPRRPGGSPQDTGVLFAHGSRSSRHTPRTRFVAPQLRRRGLATLLTDLLTPEEEAVDLRTAQYRFDIELLGRRLVGPVDWLTENPQTKALRIGLFCASTGAAAALIGRGTAGGRPRGGLPGRTAGPRRTRPGPG